MRRTRLRWGREPNCGGNQENAKVRLGRIVEEQNPVDTWGFDTTLEAADTALQGRKMT